MEEVGILACAYYLHRNAFVYHSSLLTMSHFLSLRRPTWLPFQLSENFLAPKFLAQNFLVSVSSIICRFSSVILYSVFRHIFFIFIRSVSLFKFAEEPLSITLEISPYPIFLRPFHLNFPPHAVACEPSFKHRSSLALLALWHLRCEWTHPRRRVRCRMSHDQVGMRFRWNFSKVSSSWFLFLHLISRFSNICLLSYILHCLPPSTPK